MIAKSPRGSRNRMSVCLLIHGFTGSPHEVAPLARYLREQGYEVHTPVLAGHGGTRSEMKRATWQDWIAGVGALMVELQRAGKDVHLVGFSMGGLIAAYLAGKYAIRSLTFLSTPIYYVNKRQMVRTISETIRNQQCRVTGEKYSIFPRIGSYDLFGMRPSGY